MRRPLPVIFSLLLGAMLIAQVRPSLASSAHAPATRRFSISDPTAAQDVVALYIAPAEFHAALAPLLELRQSQGMTATLIDAQRIFDVWSDGQQSPQAIRAFLQHARNTWPTPPRAVILVGDGVDPRSTTTIARSSVRIPPLMADVDPWLGETACDWCFVQLDGETPEFDLQADMLYGRLPARDVDDARAIVAKILLYETQNFAPWRSRTALIADNYQDADGTPDGAGNFAWLLDQALPLQPAGWFSRRVYYDPYQPTASQDSWREPSTDAARAQTRSAFEDGAGLVVYSGHGLVDRWASTSPAAEGQSWLLHADEVGTLTNKQRLPVVIELACLTGSFQTGIGSQQSIDERLVTAPNGGAVAVIGFSGWSVAYVNEIVLHGMLKSLRGADGAPVLLGEMFAAGQNELRVEAKCCQEALRTMVLLGDPLTRIRTQASVRSVLLPLVGTSEPNVNYAP